MNRRDFLGGLGLAAGGSYLLFNGFSERARALVRGAELSSMRAYGYGQLSAIPSRNTNETVLALPKGFEYTIIGKQGKTMTDGRPTPPKHDGMAAFRVGSELRLVRNHEVTNSRLPIQGSAIGSSNHYDETAGGGTTTLVVDTKTREIIKDFVSLSGTLVNCAGGSTPWGSWISCEETTLGSTVIADSKGKKSGGFAKPHGYCFEVPASADTNLPPVPLKAMGRFVHEAVSVDAKSGVVYLTEDNNPAGLYRFLPKRARRLSEGGELQILKIRGKDSFDTRKNQKIGEVLDVEWMTIGNPDPEEADVDPSAVFKQGAARGAAMFARLEGCAIDAKGRFYFDSTSGGDGRGGQIWMYEPVSKDAGRLTLKFESPDRKVLDMPDNMCLEPHTGRLFICEDSDYVGEGGSPDNFIRILTPDGKMADFARNVSSIPTSEFAGSTFSPDGKTLFCNLQVLGITIAIWGDWKNFRS